MDMGNTDLESKGGKQGPRGTFIPPFKETMPGRDGITPASKYGVNPSQPTKPDVTGWENEVKRRTRSFTPSTTIHTNNPLEAGGTGRESFSPVLRPSGFNF